MEEILWVYFFFNTSRLFFFKHHASSFLQVCLGLFRTRTESATSAEHFLIPPHRIISYTISLCHIHVSVDGGPADGQWEQNNQEAFNENQSKKMQLPTELIKIFHLHSQGYSCREKKCQDFGCTVFKCEEVWNLDVLHRVNIIPYMLFIFGPRVIQWPEGR